MALVEINLTPGANQRTHNLERMNAAAAILGDVNRSSVPEHLREAFGDVCVRMDAVRDEMDRYVQSRRNEP